MFGILGIKEIYDLYNKLVAINTWIINHPSVIEPNYYEIMDCALLVGDIFSRLKNYEPRTTEEELFLVINSRKLKLEVSRMIQLRDLTNHPFMQENEEVSRLLFHTIDDCLSGNLTHFDDLDVEKTRNHVLRNCVSISFYIWQVRQNEKRYTYYDKPADLEEVLENYSVFKNYCLLNENLLSTNDKRMLEEMSIVFKQIGNDYKCINNKNKVK